MSGLLTIDFCIIKFEKGDKIMMLQARNVSIYISKDDRLLIDDFSFALNQSDKVAIIGEEGNGKSTLSEFNGTIISISHDRMYLDEVADVIYELSDNGLNTVL